jgi:lathosterol oxidase
MKHPRFLKNQIRTEIKVSMDSFVPVGLMTVPIFVGDVRGHSMLYSTLADGPLGGGLAGWAYLAFSAAAFLLFTDYLIYWVHRILHHPILYKRIHKSHHRFVSEFLLFDLDPFPQLSIAQLIFSLFFQFPLHSHRMRSIR